MWIPEICGSTDSRFCGLCNFVAPFLTHVASSLHLTPAFAKALFELSSLASDAFQGLKRIVSLGSALVQPECQWQESQ